MSAVPVARYLADFGADDGIAGAQRGGGEAAKNVGAAKLDEAFARGLEAGKAAARAELEVKLAEQRSASAQRLAAERQAWAEGTGEKLAKGLLVSLQELESRIAETVARVLKPFVADRLHAQAIAELQASLDMLASTASGTGLHISGPADILQALRERLAGKNVSATYAPSEDCDVRIVAGQTVLETRLQEWRAKLDEVMR